MFVNHSLNGCSVATSLKHSLKCLQYLDYSSEKLRAKGTVSASGPVLKAFT